MTIFRYNNRSGRNPAAGFTLVELIIATTIGSIVLAGVLTTFLLLVRSGVRVANYSAMETQTRRAFEQLGIDARMASDFSAHFDSGQIDYFTLTIPNNDLTAVRTVTYGYDTSNSSDRKFFFVPGSDAAATTGRIDLITGVSALTILRYDKDHNEIPASTTDSSGIKHLQVSAKVVRSAVGVTTVTQTIRSSAFTLRNISL